MVVPLSQVQQVMGLTDHAQRVIQAMSKREVQQKMILGFVFVLILGFIGTLIYFVVTRSK